MRHTENKILILITITLFIIVQVCVATGNTNSKFYIKTNVANVDGTKMGIKPGDTVFIEAGHRDHLRLYNIHGDSLNYIVFINNGGLVEISTNIFYYGFQVKDCSYFKLTGTGSDLFKYGIKIGHTPIGASGLTLDGTSTNYEVEHIECVNSGFAGICANPKPDCDENLNRANFTRKNTTFHDNYVHSTYGEAFYVGHSSYTGYTITCDSVKKLVYPHEIHGLQIYNNVIDSSGWDGIQVGCATIGCKIYGNKVSNYGVRNTKDQNFGIIMNAGTGGDCYNNLITNGTCTGINVFGIGGNKIYNNIIVNPGHAMNDTMITTNACGIFCDDRCTTEGSSFYFLNNTIISPKGDGIRIYSKLSKHNVISNNIILNPGSYGTYGSYVDINKSFVFTYPNVDVSVSNNYCSSSISAGIDYLKTENIFNYCKYLPVIDKVIDISNYNINADFNNNSRVVNGISDIGAFEYPDSIIQRQKSKSIKIISNNSSRELHIYSEKKEQINNVSIYQLSGQLIYTNSPNNDEVAVTLNKNTGNGIYLVCASTNNEECRSKISICYQN